MNWLPKKERKFFLIVLIILLVIIFFPHIFGLLQQGDNYWYTGGKMFREYDTYAYYSYMEQARQGRWGFYQLGLLAPQKPYFFHPLWLLLGKAGLITGMSNLAVYLLAQVILIFIFLLIWWNFIKYFFQMKNSENLFLFSHFLQEDYSPGFMKPQLS
jgi:hypothetical protein